ncbi:MAG: TIGR03808 family TAT-translocated repetitive protein [Rhodoblastus sp.]
MTKMTIQPDCVVLSTAAGSDTLQAAINAAQSAGIPLNIAGGIYTTAPLTITAAVTIVAAKNGVLLRSTGSNAIHVSVGSTSGRIGDVVFKGVSFDGESKPLAAGASGIVAFTQTDRIVIEDCSFWRANGVAVALSNSGGRVAGNSFDTCDTALSSVNATGLTVENNSIFNSANNGVMIVHQPYGQVAFDGAIIHRNRIYQTNNASGGSGQFGNAIICNQTRYLRITDNFIAGANFSAIRCNLCPDAVISGNQVYNARETAIFVENPGEIAPGWSNIVVTNNTLNTVGGGIHLVNTNAGARRAAVVGNVIYNSLQNQFPEYTTPDTNPANKYTRITHGSGIVAGEDCIVEGNAIELTAGPGVMALVSGTWNSATQSAPDRNTVSARVSGNILKQCEVGVGYWDYDTRGFAEIADNIVSGATAASIIRMQGTNLVGVPGNPNNGWGPFAIVAGSSDMGATASPITDRFSFNRNKIVPATN